MEYNVERIRDTLYRIEDIVSQDREVNWEQARVDAAIGAMQGIIANSHDDDYRYVERGCSQIYKYKLQRADIVHRAVMYADALIAELKKKGE